MKKEGDRATEFQVDEQELQALSQRVAERRIEEKDWPGLPLARHLFCR